MDKKALEEEARSLAADCHTFMGCPVSGGEYCPFYHRCEDVTAEHWLPLVTDKALRKENSVFLVSYLRGICNGNYIGLCPVGTTDNCPFDGKSCPEVTDEDWDYYLRRMYRDDEDY